MPTQDRATQQPPTGEQQPPQNEEENPEDESSPSDSDSDSGSDYEDTQPESQSDTEEGEDTMMAYPNTDEGELGDNPEEGEPGDDSEEGLLSDYGEEGNLLGDYPEEGELGDYREEGLLGDYREHGVRMFWQPPLKEGEDVDPEKVEFLPLGFDEFYGRDMAVKNFFNRLMSSVENTLKPWFEILEKWVVEEQQKAVEDMEQKLIDVLMDLEDLLRDIEQELKQLEKEVEKSVEMSLLEEDVSTSPSLPDNKEEVVSPQEENVEEEEEEEEDEDDSALSSFGSVADEKEEEMELIDALMALEEAIEDVEQVLKQLEKEDEMSLLEEDVSTSPSLPDKKEEVVSPQEENVEEEEEEEEDEDDSALSSFGSVADQGSTKNKGNGSGRSPFSALSFASSGLLSMVSSMVERSFLLRKIGKSPLNPKVHTPFDKAMDRVASSDLVAFPRAYPKKISLKVKFHADQKFVVKHQHRKVTTTSQISSVSSQLMRSYNYQDGPQNRRVQWLHVAPETRSECILSLQMPVECLNLCFRTSCSQD